MSIRLISPILLLVFVACSVAPILRGRSPSSAGDQRPYDHPMAATKKGLVVTCQPLAANMGAEILRKGGSAADAFIAATLGEYVTAYGYTSLSGPLYVLYYDAKTKTSHYLNAGNNKVSDPNGQFDPAHPIAGKSFVIGGAGPGLDSLHHRFGRLSLEEDAMPAANLARNGFPIPSIFAWTINNRKPLFTNATAWNSLFVPNGVPLSTGKTLIQKDLADTLTQFGAQGADYLMRGRYAEDLVKTVQAAGGKLTLPDLANYKVNWSKPLTAKYRDFEVQTDSYRSAGGPLLLLELKAIEHDQRLNETHFTTDENTLKTVLRTFLFSLHQQYATWNNFSQRMDTLEQQTSMLSGPVPETIWNSVSDLSQPAPWTNASGSHSCATMVIDRDGDIVADVHTINSLQWGDYGLMNDGVSLNSAYSVNGDAPPGERTIDPLSPMLIFHNGHPVAAASFFDGSLQAAAFQVALNLMDYGMNSSNAVFTPRFGAPLGFLPLTLPLDPRFPTSWVDDFAKTGVVLQQPKTSLGGLDMSAYVDTGDAMVIRIDENTGMHYGSPSEVLPEAIAETE